MTLGWSAGLLVAAAMGVIGARGSLWLQPSRVASDPKVASSPWRGRSPRRREPSDLEVAGWCDDVARHVRSGMSLTAALQDAATGHPLLRSVFDPLLAPVARGSTLADALRAVEVDPTSAHGLAVVVLRACAELGGPTAAPLERVAATLRTRDAVRQEQVAQSAQAQMSARVMTFVPIGMLGLLATTDPDVRGAVATPAGLTAVVSGAMLNLAGWVWMQRIVRRA